MDISIVVIWIACALICFSIAKDKGKNVYVAIAWGLCFGLFAILGYALSKGSDEYQLKKAEDKVKKLKK